MVNPLRRERPRRPARGPPSVSPDASPGRAPSPWLRPARRRTRTGHPGRVVRPPASTPARPRSARWGFGAGRSRRRTPTQRRDRSRCFVQRAGVPARPRSRNDLLDDLAPTMRRWRSGGKRAKDVGWLRTRTHAAGLAGSRAPQFVLPRFQSGHRVVEVAGPPTEGGTSHPRRMGP
jgi:hypothetical protein